MKRLALLLALAASSFTTLGATMPTGADNFYKSDTVTVERVTFKNQYHMEVVGNLVRPKATSNATASAAVIVGHPMGAVKEQSSMLYAQKLAEQGFVTLAIDLPFWGESEGEPRNLVAPEMYSEAFSAAVDYLGDPRLHRPRAYRCARHLWQRQFRHQRGQDASAAARHCHGQHV